MAKNLKKPVKKQIAKPSSKAAVKPAGKTAKPVKGSAAKSTDSGKQKKSDMMAKSSKAPASDKNLKKAGATKAAPVKPSKDLKGSEQKSDKKSDKKSDLKLKKESKKGKKAKDEFELEGDDLLTSDEEVGSEDIPDLSEFEETEIEETLIIEESDSDDADAISAEVKSRDDEVVLTDAEGRVYCRVRDCDQISAVEGYCRYHYLLLWKKIQVRRKILVDGKLERYVEELTSRYPDKFLEMIRKDLRTEKDFLAAIAELEIDEAANDAEFEDESQSFADEMRGITSEAGMSDEEEF
jgi:hypothetical protein